MIQDEPRSVHPFAGAKEDAWRVLGLWIWSVLVVADAIMLTRRVSGHFDAPVPLHLAVVSTIVVGVMSWIGWRIQSSGNETSRPQLASNRMIPKGIALGIVLVWSWGISSTPMTYGLNLGILLALAIAIFPPFRFEDDGTINAFVPTDMVTDRGVTSARNVESLPSETPLEVNDGANPTPSCQEPTVTDPTVCESAGLESETSELTFEDSATDDDQHQTLWLCRKFVDDHDIVEGWVRVAFESGQRETQVHIAFCPPLPGIPEIETEDLDGVGLEIRVAVAFGFGARFSIRRTEMLDEMITHRVGFIARAVVISRAA